MSFTELNLSPLIVRRLEDMAYHTPTPIQAQAIGPILSGRDVIGLAPTGTGKTAAFGAPVAHHLLEHKPESRKKSDRLRALVLCPTRELAQQVEAEISSIIRGSLLRSVCVFGGVGMQPQAEAVAAGADIVVGTPGRVRDLIEAEAMSLSRVRHVMIDEGDRMFDMGFLPQVEELLDRVPRAAQVALFTATMPDPVATLVEKHLKKPVRIEIGQHTRTADHVEQTLLPVEDHLKTKLLLRLLEDGPRSGVLIFARTKRRVGWVAAALKRNGIEVAQLHGDRTQAQRQRALEQFRAGELRVIVASDVAARGLHIEAVRTVINYDLPVAPEDYVHRVGRAGHGGGFGESFSLVSRDERAYWNDLAEMMEITIKPVRWPDFDYDEKPRRGRERTPRGGDAAPRETSAKPARRKRPSDAELEKRRPPRKGLKQRGLAKRPLRSGEKPGGGVRRPKPPQDDNS